MAMYRLEVKNVSRKNRRNSVVKAAAYRVAQNLWDKLRGKFFDYSKNENGVEKSVILTPDGAPEWAKTSEQLWNQVEMAEKRKDARLAREFLLSLPKELSRAQQYNLAVDWVKKELISKGFVAEVSFHHPPGKWANPHAHVLVPTRTLDGDKFSAKKPREWNETAALIHWRESWCNAENAALEKAGRPERVDHRSLRDRGLDLIPQPKIGPAAMAMKKRGVPDPLRFQEVRKVRLFNEIRPLMRAIQNHWNEARAGAPASFWERSWYFLSRVKDSTRDAMQHTWSRLVQSQRDYKQGPELER